jgi:1-phosphofructokinase family hexose kinase
MILTVTLNPAVDFTVFGEAFSIGVTNRGDCIDPDAGGKGNNAARIANLLGSRVAATGFLGGFTGDYIGKCLAKEGIEDVFFPISGLTRITVSFIAQGGREQTKIVPTGDSISPEDAKSFKMHFRNLMEGRRFSVVTLNGSLPRGLPPDYYADLIDICAAASTPVILDTSGEALRAARGHSLRLIKPNYDEARELLDCTGGPQLLGGVREFARETGNVALTLGERGAILFTKGGAVAAKAAAVKGTNPIGAGDAFVGGFAAATDADLPEPECFRWAVAAATCTASSPGLLWERSYFDSILRGVALETFKGDSI